MPAIQLTPAERKAKRSEAHHLNPVVLIGADGLTEAVKKETDAALKAHGLIKLRVFSDDRTAREAMMNTLAEELDAAAVQHIGKLLVLWRPVPEKAEEAGAPRGSAPKTFKVVKYNNNGTGRPTISKVTVFGNQRLTAGGNVKRAKTRTVSTKKRSQDR
ncbi:YhbY family RNA-binding protein [Ideonella livida]|uniref:YhbY family RNA-binding protein n=1 Tax=Ideonella livida TaxID=2707176 RepID=A0A7C9PEK2_9BURK|nr:YhbY family RNA-binding protein [Ideonella livida]NDY89611.1 YhbY family RNA-binding protein [Ideonella livida]